MIKYPTNTIQRCIDCNGSTALPVGQNGLNGEYGGYSSLWKFNSSTTPGDPNSNYLLIDSGVGSAFKIYVSTTNADGTNMNGFLGSLDDNGVTGNHGYLRLFKEYDSNTHKYYKLKVVQNLGAYYILEVELIDSNNSFTNNDDIVLTFTESGIPGTNGTAGTNGTNGTNGADGSDGDYGGFSRMWKFDTATGVSPSSTYLRLNNATFGATTSVYINTTDAVANASGFLGAIQNSTNYGMIKIFKEYDSSNYVLYNVTGWSTVGTYVTLTVSYLGGNGSFSMNDNVVLSFTPRGASYAPLINFLFTIGSLETKVIPQSVGLTQLRDGTVLVPTLISVEQDYMNAYNPATGIWTCPVQGYYDISFFVGFTQGSFTGGAGYVYAGITDGLSPTANIIACSDIATVDSAGTTAPTAIQLSSAYVMRQMTVGTQLAIRILNKSAGSITCIAGSSAHFCIKLVQTY